MSVEDEKVAYCASWHGAPAVLIRDHLGRLHATHAPLNSRLLSSLTTSSSTRILSSQLDSLKWPVQDNLPGERITRKYPRHLREVQVLRPGTPQVWVSCGVLGTAQGRPSTTSQAIAATSTSRTKARVSPTPSRPTVEDDSLAVTSSAHSWC